MTNTLNISNYYFDDGKLQETAKKLHHQYVHEVPFEHIVIDNALPISLLEDVLEDFPDKHSSNWKEFNHSHSRKLQSEPGTMYPDSIRMLLNELNSSRFLRFLETLTGINGLIPDPYYEGGGLHNIERGGKLGIHTDFNFYERLGLIRQLNILVYINKDWLDEYGGHLELWDSNMTQCMKKILPIFNRMVIFNTNDSSYHGHPEPLSCPIELSRKSIALYYYKVPKNSNIDKHSTIYKTRPKDKIKDEFFRLVRFILPPVIIYTARWIHAKILKH